MDIDWIGREVVHPKSHVAFLVEVGVFLHHLGMEQLGKVSLKALIVWPALGNVLKINWTTFHHVHGVLGTRDGVHHGSGLPVWGGISSCRRQEAVGYKQNWL